MTEEHPFWVDRPGDDEGYIWLPAGELRAGDVLSAVERDGASVRLDGGTLTVSANVLSGENEPVYNLTVEDFHTYTVGYLNVQVHNTCQFDDLDELSFTHGSLDTTTFDGLNKDEVFESLFDVNVNLGLGNAGNGIIQIASDGRLFNANGRVKWLLDNGFTQSQILDRVRQDPFSTRFLHVIDDLDP